jgi:hypothetical protein
MPLDESGGFDPEPRTQADYLRELWRDMKLVKVQVFDTNGRVTRLEKMNLILAGVLFGLFAKEVAPLILPLFGIH